VRAVLLLVTAVLAAGCTTPVPGTPSAAGPVPLARFPAVLPASPAVIRGRAPQLGEHTDEVLGEIGYDQTEIDELRKTGAV